MELTIYNTYVLMESQEQCDRMKKLCIDNNLPIWVDEDDDDLAFALFELSRFFRYGINEFYVGSSTYNKTQVTEQEFINLLIKKITTPKEKFLELVSKEKSNTIEKIRNRRQKKMDEYAIEFAEWCFNYVPENIVTSKELLEIFKKEVKL